MADSFDRALAPQNLRFPIYEYLILFLPVAILMLVVGFSFAVSRTESQVNAILDGDDSRLQQITGFISAQVSVSLNHLLAVSEEASLTQALESQSPASLDSLEASFLTLVRRNPFYSQVRWIDETGQERVRISRDDTGVHIDSRRELQNKRHRYYFEAARDLLSGEIYLSPVDFNVEHGQVQIPYNPVLRLALPVTNKRREARGIVILNIAMRHVFDALENLRYDGGDVQYLLLNHSGQVLNAQSVNPEAAAVEEGGANFVASYASIWKQIEEDEIARLEGESGLWTWRRLTAADIFDTLRRAYPKDSSNIDHLIADQLQLILVAHRKVGFLVELRRDSRMLVSLGTLLGLVVFGLSMFLYLNSHVRERRAELRAGFAIAKAEQQERIKSLEERFQRMFEVSSVGQIVVDNEGSILLGNATAEKLLAYDAEKLEGLAVDSLLPDAKRDKHKQLRTCYAEFPEARKMGEGRKLEALTGDGRLIPVEVGLNPYSDNGRELILVSIIDLSARV